MRFQSATRGKSPKQKFCMWLLTRTRGKLWDQLKSLLCNPWTWGPRGAFLDRDGHQAKIVILRSLGLGGTGPHDGGRAHWPCRQLRLPSLCYVREGSSSSVVGGWSAPSRVVTTNDSFTPVCLLHRGFSSLVSCPNGGHRRVAGSITTTPHGEAGILDRGVTPRLVLCGRRVCWLR